MTDTLFDDLPYISRVEETPLAASIELTMTVELSGPTSLCNVSVVIVDQVSGDIIAHTQAHAHAMDRTIEHLPAILREHLERAVRQLSPF